MDSDRKREPSIEDLVELVRERGPRLPFVQELNPELRTTKYADPGDVADAEAYFVRPQKREVVK